MASRASGAPSALQRRRGEAPGAGARAEGRRDRRADARPQVQLDRDQELAGLQNYSLSNLRGKSKLRVSLGFLLVKSAFLGFSRLTRILGK